LLYTIPIAFLILYLVGLADVDLGLFILSLTLCFTYQIPFKDEAKEIDAYFQSIGDTSKAGLADEYQADAIVLFAIASAMLIIHLGLVSAYPTPLATPLGAFTEAPVAVVYGGILYSHLSFIFLLKDVRKAKRLSSNSPENKDNQKDDEDDEDDTE